MKQCINDDGLAFLIAHELGHLVANHSNTILPQRYLLAKQVYLSYLLRSLPFPFSICSLFHAIAHKRHEKAFYRRKRRNEFEADSIAFHLTTRAGYDPRAGYDFIKMVDGIIPDKGEVA